MGAGSFVEKGNTAPQRLTGTHTESNHRLMNTWAWASPQKCRAAGPLATSRFHLCTASFRSPHSITNQWIGFAVTIPQISHLNSFKVDITVGLSPGRRKLPRLHLLKSCLEAQ